MIDTLYELIGGRTAVHAAVESFYRKVLADPSLSHFFQQTDMPHQIALQSMFISMLLGGRVVYTGKDVRTAHAGAREKGLNDSHFDAFLKHFRAALEEAKVPPEKLEKVMTLLEGTRNAVLGR
jgi:truncated hemoglobin YjbI